MSSPTLQMALENPPQQHRFTIYNDKFFNSRTPGRIFHHFSQLPPEIRLKVWNIFLQKHRFLRVEIFPVPETEQPPQPANSSQLEIPIDHEPEFHAFFRNLPRPCILSSVCREAAQASREFYRVRLPCYLTRPAYIRRAFAPPLAPVAPNIDQGHRYRHPGMPCPNHSCDDEVDKEGVACLNPEWDILDINPHDMEMQHGARDLVHFLHRLEALDAKSVGISNLSLGLCHIKLLAELDLRELSASVLASYRQVIAGLRQLFWRATSKTVGRLIGGPFENPRALPWYNVSLPLMANRSAVEFVGPDTRLFQPDLHQVWVGSDPRSIPGHWDRMERALGVRAGQAGNTFRCRYLLGHETWTESALWTNGPESPGIVDRGSAEAYLRRECAKWARLGRPEIAELSAMSELTEKFWRRAQEKFTPDLSYISPAEVVPARLCHTAVGFWLFNADALGEEPIDDFTARMTGKIAINLDGLSPELCLFDLWS